MVCRYQAQLDMNHNLQGWQLRNKGKLVLSTPDNAITTTWEHSNGLNDITCSLTSSWGSGRELKVGWFVFEASVKQYYLRKILIKVTYFNNFFSYFINGKFSLVVK